LNGTPICNEKNARPIGLFLQSQSVPIVLQAGVALDEIVLAELEKGRDARYLVVG